jgi:hypothetical protein
MPLVFILLYQPGVNMSYEYLRLPMGSCNNPDISREILSELMFGLAYARAYVDDLLMFSKGSIDNHIVHLKEVFTRLVSAGLKVNATKSHFCCDELEYLQYLINRKGIRPTLKKSGGYSKNRHTKNQKAIKKRNRYGELVNWLAGTG